MAADAISTDAIFVNIFETTARGGDDAVLEDFDYVDNLILKNECTGDKRVVGSFKNFERLVKTMVNKKSQPHQINNNDVAGYGIVSNKCLNLHHDTPIEPHDWSVQGNCFVVMVKPYIETKYYDLIKNDLDFTQFLQSNKLDHANESYVAGAYRYWPNIQVLFFGWRQFLLMRYNIDVGEYVPLIHNRRLGNVNLFEFFPKFFLNVEMHMTCGDKKMFVNGRTRFGANHDDLFLITMADGSKGSCKVNDCLVYSNKNLFNYIRDDINLTECITADKYKHLIRVDLKKLRVFKESPVKNDYLNKDKLKVDRVITASSENDDIQKHVRASIEALNEHMTALLAKHETEEDNVLVEYLIKSDLYNFDYLIVVLWRLLIQNDDFEFGETDIRLYLEVLCEILFDEGTKYFDAVRKRCEPYYKLLPKVFSRFCNHWTLFLEEDALESLAAYFSIHFMIYFKLSATANDDNTKKCWDYTYENAIKCGASQELLCKGFFKKIQTPGACLVFNGKHYIMVKKDEELFKLTEKANPVMLSSAKFNTWKYLYFTEEGVYNLFINAYHSSTPFILGNTLMGALTKKNETTYLPESAVNFMLENGKHEVEIFKIYHMAKVCRDVRQLKTNISIVLAFKNCDQCLKNERVQLNDLFREIWMYNTNEYVVLGMYLNKVKIYDLINNLKCRNCQQKKIRKKCQCYSDMEIDFYAFKLAIMAELFSCCKAVIELMWSLLYSSTLYTKILIKSARVGKLKEIGQTVIKHANYFNVNRIKIIEMLYKQFDKIDHVDTLIYKLSSACNLAENVQELLLYSSETDDSAYDGSEDSDSNKENEDDAVDDDDDGDTGNDASDKNKNDALDSKRGSAISTKRLMPAFYQDYCSVMVHLKKWNVWWDKLIVARHDDDLSSWLNRFYMRIVMSKINCQDYSYFFVKKIVTGYLYFRNFTNFNYTNSLLMMHYDASMGIPSDYEKCCIYLNGEPGSGKSSNFELMENIVVVHKHDAENYTLSKKETDEMEANKMISQLYVINEMKECNDSFFKSTADSTKSNAVCRKYQGSQKYEGNFKLMIVNNKPLYISNYDKGVRNRFAIVYTEHVFEENLQFSGSVYSHIMNKKFPMEKTYFEGLVTPVRLFLSHILMYKRNHKDGYVSYKNLVKHDPVHNHNLMCLDINNSPINALIYVLRVRIKHGAHMVDENKVDKTIELAAPFVEILIHDLLKTKRNQNRVAELCNEFKKRFKKCYRSEERAYFNIEMAWDRNNFNTEAPYFKC